MENYIAEFIAPKQRITRLFGYVIRYHAEHDRYSVHTKFYDDEGGYGGGVYNLSYDEAAQEFAQLVTRHVTHYTPETFEKAKGEE
jgi:hypothetical protein